MAPSGSRRKLALRGAVAALALTATACAGSPDAGDGQDRSITFGLVVDATGPMSSIFGSGLWAMEAAIAEANANGGVNGHEIKYKVYDSQSTRAGGLNAARTAIADDVFAVLAMSPSLDAGLPTLSAAKVPTLGDGTGGNWTDRPAIFSISGNIITENTTAWMQVLVDKGRTKLAIPGGSTVPEAVATWSRMTPLAGGEVCWTRTGIDGTNTATIVSVAQQMIDAGCQGVVNADLYPGAEALQASLNQLGADIPEVQAAVIGPEVIKQYGGSVDNMIHGGFFASPYADAVPGVREFKAAMAKHQPGRPTECFCIKGYAIARWALHTLGELTAAPTKDAYTAALDKTDGYTANGLVPPVKFPDFHTRGALCLSFSAIENGKWTPLNEGENPFVCGQRYSYTGK